MKNFLWAIGERETADKIRYAYNNHRSCSVHTKALDYFYEYLITGGLPEVVDAYANKCHYGYLDSIKERVFDINKTIRISIKI